MNANENMTTVGAHSCQASMLVLRNLAAGCKENFNKYNKNAVKYSTYTNFNR